MEGVGIEKIVKKLQLKKYIGYGIKGTPHQTCGCKPPGITA